jgi:hypothetical protein
MTSNISLSYPDRIDECLVSDAYDNTNWSSKLPLVNVQNKVLKKWLVLIWELQGW